MNLAIITDSTCDLSAEKLKEIKVRRVPLYVRFKDHMYKDWIEIQPKDIVEGVKAGAATPTTSQPSPQDFENTYREAVAHGADEILCITISSELSGTYQSAHLAKDKAGVPVTLVNSQTASLGLGALVLRAAAMRDEGKSTQEIVQELERIKRNSQILFTVGTLEFLQKGGRIGKAQALVGSLLNIKPILGLEAGKIVPVGKARGAKKALKEMVDHAQEFARTHSGRATVHFLHVQDEEAANSMRQALKEAGLSFTDAGAAEIGAVIATHVGPGTYGFFIYAD